MALAPPSQVNRRGSGPKPVANNIGFGMSEKEIDERVRADRFRYMMGFKG